MIMPTVTCGSTPSATRTAPHSYRPSSVGSQTDTLREPRIRDDPTAMPSSTSDSSVVDEISRDSSRSVFAVSASRRCASNSWAFISATDA